MSSERDIAMHIDGAKLIVTIVVPDPLSRQKPRRLHTRVSSKDIVDDILKPEILEHIDRAIAGYKTPEKTLEDTIPFGQDEPELAAEVGGILLPVVSVRPRGVEALFSPTLAEVDARRGYDGGAA